MSIFGTIEAVLDRIVPRVESSAVSSRKLSRADFQDLPERLASVEGLTLASESAHALLFKCAGSSRSALASVAVIAGAKPDLAWYSDIKCRLHLSHLDDGSVQVTAYEHLLGFPSERRAFAKVLQAQADRFVSVLSAHAT